MKQLMIKLIRFYQKYISPLSNPSCRYIPTCSHYAIEAIETHGALKGGYLAAKRLLRCNPWGGMGYDPVPQKCEHHHAKNQKK
ncbi:MAG: membrane protein insertion efficiency factor YidD [Turicibacter sp.]|nr:membrane protein insertion efficiency factor YidD [Turicibacter sp.]